MKVAVIGAGMQAEAVCFDLVKQPDLDEILLVDIDSKKIDGICARNSSQKLVPMVVDASCQSPFIDMLKAFRPDAMLSAAPYHMNLFLLAAALEVPCSFCDLGGNNEVVESQRQFDGMAKNLGVSIIPATGLAPGLPAVLAADSYGYFDSIESFEVRVGGLPRIRGGLLDYSMVFSIEGLVNEYIEPARVLKCGAPATVESLTDLETLEFSRQIGPLEAFVTSGALSTMPDTYAGRIQTLNYKTIRYPGHASFFITMKRLGLLGADPVIVDGVAVTPRRVFETLAPSKLGSTADDMVLMRTTVKGFKGGRRSVKVYELIDYAANGLTAMMRSTAFPASVTLLMLARGEVSMKGFAPLELSVDPKKFLKELLVRGIQITMTPPGSPVL